MNKILFIINVDWYFKLHWLERAEFFQQQGFSISVITNFTSDKIRMDLVQKGFECHHIQLKRKSLNPFTDLYFAFKLATLIYKIKPTIIHSVTIKPNIYSGIVNKLLFNKPIVYSVPGLGAVFSSSNYRFSFIKKMIVQLYRIISNSNSIFIFENQDDHDLFINEKIIKHNNGIVIKGAGIDLNKFSISPPSNSRTVLFAARLLKDKGLHQLITAKQLLQKQHINFTLKVAGIIDLDVSSAIPLSEILEWQKQGDIEWLGNVKEMPTLIKSCDIICLPTTYGEGVPRILIEAASCQKAIIATNVAGCREIIDDGVNGLLAEPGSVESLCECLKLLLLDECKAYNYGVAGRLKVIAEFSQEIVFEKTLSVYRELI